MGEVTMGGSQPNEEFGHQQLGLQTGNGILEDGTHVK